MKTASKPKSPGHQANLALKQYEAALKLFRGGNFAKAATDFGSISGDSGLDGEFRDRARVWQEVARKRAAGPEPEPKDFDECYYRGIMAANDGRLEEAVKYIEKAVREDSSSGKAVYALAAVCALRQDAAGAVEHLAKAISIEPSNGIRALNDLDFESLRENPEFMSLFKKAVGADA